MLKLAKSLNLEKCLTQCSRRVEFSFNKISKLSYSQSNKDDLNENNENKIEINPNYVNRNPRNLEWSGHQQKRFGWNLQYPSKDFYHRCSFKKVRNYLEGIVEHSSGEVIIKASTSELPLRQYLYSTRDVCAAINLARLLTDRCTKAGITQMDYLKSLTFDDSKKEQAFYKTLVKNGILFEEPDFIERPDNIQGLDYENEDFYTERQNLPFPPDVNRLKRKNLFLTLESLDKLKEKN